MSVLNWLKANGPPNGWFLGRPKDEPWHWVYRGTGAARRARHADDGGSRRRRPPTPSVSAADPRRRDRAIAGDDEIALGATGTGVKILRLLLSLAPAETFDAETDAAVARVPGGERAHGRRQGGSENVGRAAQHDGTRRAPGARATTQKATPSAGCSAGSAARSTAGSARRPRRP